MAAPVISSITFDQATYAPGAKVTATVNYTAGTQGTPLVFSDVATDKATGLSGSLSATFMVVQPDSTTHAASDSGGRAWTQVSDSGTVAVFTATA